MPASSTVSKPPSLPSLSSTSITHSQSSRSNAFTAPSTIRTVVTAPPWAQDEPPSPTDQPEENDKLGQRSILDNRPSDLASSSRSSFGGMTGGIDNHSPWWTFARPRDGINQPDQNKAPSDRPWPHTGSRRVHHDPIPISREKDSTDSSAGLQLSIPSPTPFTMSHSKTPGWDSPWQARNDFETDHRGDYAHLGGNAGERQDNESGEKSTFSRSRRSRFRAFILSNIYVPLLFRFINITFTTSALAVAIRIRQWELQYHVMGVVGSSPTLIIIFAPLTLVHVMVAIYLEYFSRPLGLWRTSGKLAHTLLEVCFICAWSAALSLCFDNYFTSLIPCASPASTAWYSQLPQPEINLPNLGRGEGGVGDTICDDQLALICLVGVGLVMYCINLVISLFRIFEKVKYHGGIRQRT
ncbi:hypothetical protein HYDPIDRAFT_173079 [Hydnomerulius pinastri MD-312]|nr:hypothetical protein HYDPIDRAFT_173079 [Hydnomerulius pinastri MD-312]